MSDQAPEQEQEQTQGHPAWQEILGTLEELPEEFRTILEPKLTEKLKSWDEGVNGKLQAVRSEYEPYKPLIDNNIQLDQVEKALWLAQKLETDPNYIVQQAIEVFGLDYAPKGQTPSDPASTGNVDPDEEDFDLGEGEFDITKHPQFQAIQQRLDKWEQDQQEQREAQEEQQHLSALEQEIAELHSKYDKTLPDGTVIPGFNDLYVTALMAQGIEPEQAVTSFTEMFSQQAQALGLSQQQNTPQPPVVMGGDGNTGSGIPNTPTKFSELSNDDLDNMVLQMIEADKNA